MRRFGGVALALGVLLVVTACSEVAAPSPSRPKASPTPTPAAAPTLNPVLPPARYQVEFRPDIAYGPLAEERLDLCLPQGAVDLRPGVILIHGGGWTNGDKGEFVRQCSLLASEGFVAATVNYRLAPAHIWPAQLVDVQLAVRFLRAHASELLLDPARLCSWGVSAGAHLAVFLGVLAQTHAGDQAALLADQSSAVSCAVDYFGIVNLLTYGVTQSQKGLLYLLLGGATPENNQALYEDASPLFLVSAQSAPMLIVQGTQDDVVPPEQSRALQQALQNHQVPVNYLSYAGGHGFSGLSGEQVQALENQSVAFLIAYGHP